MRGMLDQQPIEERVSALITGIHALDDPLASNATALQRALQSEPDYTVSGASLQYWELLAVLNAVIKARVLLRNNLRSIETLSLLALTRYLFELVVWLRYIQKDARYAIALAHESFRLQCDHFSKLLSHLQREIGLYTRLGESESAAHEQSIQKMRDGLIDNAGIGDAFRVASNDVDRELAGNFALYADDVLWNGYEFQAHLIREKALPRCAAEELQAQTTLQSFEGRWGATLSSLRMQGKWSKRAEFVGMSDEYDFIYSYTSRLMHATPASFLTDEKSLMDSEVLALLRYVRTQFGWISSFGGARAALAQ
jgi:hypothetical protein